MRDDLLIAAVLLIGVALHAAVSRAKRRHDNAASQEAFRSSSRIANEPHAAAWKHPCARWIGLAVLMLLCGWSGTLLSVGTADVRSAFEYGPGSREIEACQRTQARFHPDISYRLRMNLIRPSSGRLRLLEGACPYGGDYVIDADGYLTCTRHGRNPTLPRLDAPRKAVPGP